MSRMHTHPYTKKSKRYSPPKMKKRRRLNRQRTSTIAWLQLSVVYAPSRVKMAIGGWMFDVVTELMKTANGNVQDQVPSLPTKSPVPNYSAEFEGGTSGRPKRPSSMSIPIPSPTVPRRVYEGCHTSLQFMAITPPFTSPFTLTTPPQPMVESSRARRSTLNGVPNRLLEGTRSVQREHLAAFEMPQFLKHPGQTQQPLPQNPFPHPVSLRRCVSYTPRFSPNTFSSPVSSRAD